MERRLQGSRTQESQEEGRALQSSGSPAGGHGSLTPGVLLSTRGSPGGHPSSPHRPLFVVDSPRWQAEGWWGPRLLQLFILLTSVWPSG